MTLLQIVSTIKQIALSQPNVRSATDGSIYDIMNATNSVKYDVVHISQTSHQSTEEWDYYGFNIFYISRLEDSLEDNRLQIQSIGKEVLDNIIRTFAENWSIPYPVSITYIPFTQKFADLTAGVYCTLRLDVPKDIICADDYLAEVVPGSGIKLQDMTVTITENGLRVFTPDAEYDGIGEIRIVTDVPQTSAVLQDKEVEYTENGSYTVQPDPAYDGLSSVSVDVLVPDRYDEGYNDGKQDGENEQKAKLTVTSFTENNTYTRENGWSAVTVNVPSTQDRYDEGYADGQAAQKALLASTSFTENNTYSRENGWSSVTVDVPDRFDEGFETGQEYQKMLMSHITVTQNGEYYSEDGYSAITVNVPTEGDADLIANLQGDYYVIPYGTTHLRPYCFHYACFSSITIPDTVTSIGRRAFANNTCLREIVIPDSVTDIGVYAFYFCTELSSVTIGSGVSSLPDSCFRDCWELPNITIPGTIENIGNGVFEGCSGLTAMTFEGLVPPTINTGNSLGSTAYTFPIYVPCASIDAYKTAFGTAYAPRIQCIGSDLATAITLNVASSITDSGQATVTIEPATAVTDLVFTSSDTTLATIDNNGTITVLSSGTVTICVYDTRSGLQDCKSVDVVKTVPPTGYTTMPLTLEIISAGTIVFGKRQELDANVTVSYSINDTSYVTIETSANSATTINVQAGDIVRWKGTNTRFSYCAVGNGDTNYIGFLSGSTAVFDAYGNTMSIIYGDNFTGKTSFPGSASTGENLGPLFRETKVVNANNLILPATTLTNRCYWMMFRGCTRLVSVPVLPALTATEECYLGMFRGCTSLATTPALPATKIGVRSYNEMFQSCTSITTAPELNSTTLGNACYGGMFQGCTNLTAAPALPATTLANACYTYMFAGCTKLTAGPTLPATSLKDSCYWGMFKGCTNLTAAPALPATTLNKACYYYMFTGCNKLQTAPVLPATKLVEKSYAYMFSGCTKLNYIKCLIKTKEGSDGTKGWVTGVASSGTFVKNANAPLAPHTGFAWYRSENGIPENWTVQDA